MFELNTKYISMDFAQYDMYDTALEYTPGVFTVCV